MYEPQRLFRAAARSALLSRPDCMSAVQASMLKSAFSRSLQRAQDSSRLCPAAGSRERVRRLSNNERIFPSQKEEESVLKAPQEGGIVLLELLLKPSRSFKDTTCQINERKQRNWVISGISVVQWQAGLSSLPTAPNLRD